MAPSIDDEKVESPKEQANEQQKQLKGFIWSMPKIELHAHLNGCVRDATLRSLAEQKRIPLSSHHHHENGNGKRRNLSDCFEIFQDIHACVNDVEALARVTAEALEDFAAHQVRYLELRSTPRRLCGCGTEGKRRYIDTILAEYKKFEASAEGVMTPRLLISVDRAASVQEAEENVSLAIEYFMNENNPYVVGMDLGGNPTKNCFRDFVPALTKAKQAGLKVSIHCGEVPNQEDEVRDILQFAPHRLGHALFVPPCMQTILQNNPIPVECCPTSNVMTVELATQQQQQQQDKSNNDKEEYNHDVSMSEALRNGHEQLTKWITSGYPLCINTDDPGVFDTDLSTEWWRLALAFGMGRKEVAELMLKSVEYMFENDEGVKLGVLEDMKVRMEELLGQEGVEK